VGEENSGQFAAASGQEIREVVRAVMSEMGFAERESLERKVNELIAENQRARAAAEEAERGATIRAELQRLGVAKIDLAYRAVKEDAQRLDGAAVRDFLARFVEENPELLPARLAGGSGAGGGERRGAETGTVDLGRIRPGMSAEELERARQEVARVAAQTLRGA